MHSGCDEAFLPYQLPWLCAAPTRVYGIYPPSITQLPDAHRSIATWKLSVRAYHEYIARVQLKGRITLAFSLGSTCTGRPSSCTGFKNRSIMHCTYVIVNRDTPKRLKLKHERQYRQKITLAACTVFTLHVAWSEAIPEKMAT